MTSVYGSDALHGVIVVENVGSRGSSCFSVYDVTLIGGPCVREVAVDHSARDADLERPLGPPSESACRRALSTPWPRASQKTSWPVGNCHCDMSNWT